MRTLSRFAVIAACAALLAGQAAAEPLEKLAGKLAKSLQDQPNKKVAVLDFSYHDGALSSGSTIVQERLTTYLVENGKIEVVERSLIKKILEEKKLEATGLIDPATTKELGKVLGVAIIITGTLNDLPKNKTEVNARAINTESGKILGAAQAKIERTWTDLPVKQGGTVAAGPTTPAQISPQGPVGGKPTVQVAILLDTSNSMDGLINQARTQIWKIVNELAGSEKGGNSPTVQVALYEYGNDGLKAEEGYIRQVLPFTTDLDHVSEKLFSLKTNGGQEYCGWVIKDAVNNLQWDPRADVYKVIFDAGNEPFTQGPVDFHESVAAAAKKGIFVNTIFCGPRQEGIATQWKAGSDIAGGDYSNIDQEAQVVSIKAPQDDEIARLGVELNSTFIAYGAGGRAAKMKQEAQDSNALAAPAAAGMATQRALFKASKQYNAASWDVVGALESGQMKESEIRSEELPENMRAMSEGERKEYITKQAEERKKLQEKINQLNAERQKYVAQKEKEQAGKGAQTLDQAVINTIHTQAAKKGFNFKN